MTLALLNYNEERAVVTSLPHCVAVPDVTAFADNRLGVAAVENGRLVGFLGCYKPWEHAFGSAAKGTFSPMHAHGAVKKGRAGIYKRLYQAAADIWVQNGIAYHAVALYAHDAEAVQSFFSYGFGLRCVDAVRPLTDIPCAVDTQLRFREIEKKEVAMLRGMREALSAHLAASPCFMRMRAEGFQEWLSRAEARASRVFIAMRGGEAIAYMEVMDEGENFATEASGMQSICGAYCLPAYRGGNVSVGLLNYIIQTLRAEGYESLGVDFESFNPTASGFWLKHFTAYTSSVTRRIDECGL